MFSHWKVICQAKLSRVITDQLISYFFVVLVCNNHTEYIQCVVYCTSVLYTRQCTSTLKCIVYIKTWGKHLRCLPNPLVKWGEGYYKALSLGFLLMLLLLILIPLMEWSKSIKTDLFWKRLNLIKKSFRFWKYLLKFSSIFKEYFKI